MKPKLLFVTAHMPLKLACQAGHKTAFLNLERLSSKYSIDLVIISASSINYKLQEFEGLVGDINYIRINKTQKFLCLMYGIFQGFAPRLSTRISPIAIKLIKEMNISKRYDSIWLEFSQVFWVSAIVDPKQRVIMSSHDIQTMLVATKSRIEILFTLGVTFITEKYFLKRANQIITQSDLDKKILMNLFKIDEKQIIVESPAVTLAPQNYFREKKLIEPYSIIFWGAMSRPENYNAILAFIDSEYKNLKFKYPDIKLYIVGSEPHPRLQRISDPSIVVTGFVPNPYEYFKRASLGVAPIIEGAGIKVKILEMLAAGLDVITTPIGAEGIKKNSKLIICEHDKFAQNIEAYWKSNV